MVDQTFNAKISATDETGPALSRVAARIEGLQALTTGLNVRFANMSARLSSVRQGLGQIAEAAGLNRVATAAGAALGQMRSLGGQIASVAAPLGALGALGSVGGLLGIMHGAVESSSSMERLVSVTRMTVRQLSEMRFVAQQTGAEFEVVSASIERLGRVQADALTGGNARAAQAFRNMGISLGTRQNPRDVFDVFADLAARMPTQSEAFQRQYGQILLGRAGRELRPVMDRFRQSRGEWMRLEELANGGPIQDWGAWNARRMSGVRQLADLGRAQQGLQAQLGALRNAVGVALAPLLMSHLGDLRDFIAANRGSIAAEIRGIVSDIATWIRSVDWRAVGREIRDVARIVGSVVEQFGGLRTVLGLLAAWVASPLIIGVGTLALAFGNLAIALTPVVVTAIAAISSGLVALAAAAVPAVGAALSAIGAAIAGIAVAIVGSPVAIGVALAAIAAGVAVLGARLAGYNWGEIFDGVIGGLRRVVEFLRSLIPEGRGQGPATDPDAQRQRRENWRNRGGMVPGADPASFSPGASGGGAIDVRVHFDNAPAGMRAEVETRGAALQQPTLEVGYAFGPRGAYA